MRELEPSLPEAAETVLDRQCYRDPGFGDLFLDYTEDLIFRDPQTGLVVADIARRLAHGLPEEGSLQGRREHRERLVRAYGLLGTAYRAAGHPDKAEGPYRTALRYCGKGVSPSCERVLLLMLAILRGYQKRYEDGVQLVDRAERIVEPGQGQNWRGRVLATRGAVFVYANRYPEAVAALSEALGQYRLSRRIEYSATANLAHAVSETDEPERLEAATVHLRRARQLAGPRRSVHKSFLYWIEGLVFVRCGSTERAEQRFKKALEGFLKFRAAYEIAVVGLDLSLLLAFARRWSELEKLAADTYGRFRELQEDTEALAALKLWLDAARNRTLTAELIAEVKAKLEERMRRRPPPGNGRRKHKRC